MKGSPLHPRMFEIFVVTMKGFVVGDTWRFAYVRPVHVLVLFLWEIELVVNVWERTREIFACNKLCSKSNKSLIWN